ncbi:MAG: hypothetical protein L6264_09195 [Weeksellaceae bacterium]|nr:hypothetical protein [Bacteroidota bacterium]MCG2781112.1 hypothetical protein [Weeksellaceae bacterium]
MKRPIIHFFLCIYLLSFTEVKQLLKLPNLVEHYISHTITNKNTTLISFVKMHYLDKQAVDSDYKQDMKLPFKTHEASTFMVNPLTIPENFGFDVNIPRTFKEKTLIFSYSPNYASNPLASIFRPPILV